MQYVLSKSRDAAYVTSVMCAVSRLAGALQRLLRALLVQPLRSLPGDTRIEEKKLISVTAYLLLWSRWDHMKRRS